MPEYRSRTTTHGRNMGLSIGDVSPETAAGGTIGLVQENDVIEINIPERRIHRRVNESELARRRTLQNQRGWQPEKARNRHVSAALRADASLTTSAAHGAVRRI